MDELYRFVSHYGGWPTQPLLDRVPVLEREIDAKDAELEAIIRKKLASVNAKIASKKLDPIKVMTKDEYDKKQQDK